MAYRDDVDELIAFLNSLVQIDPVAMGQLIKARVQCNADLANHPTVQVGAADGRYEVGLLGLLNGYAGTIDGGAYHGWGPITALLEDDGRLVRFHRTGE